MRRLCLHLLGTFRVMLDDQPVNGFRTQKARALLAYLAVEARPHERDHLAGLLWAERPDPVARTYLRQALANLRRILDSDANRPPLLLADHHTIQIDPAVFWLDSVELAEALSGLASCAARDAEQAAIARLEQAAALYRGDFLQGFSLADCEAYQEWQLQTAQSIQRQMLVALGRLSDWYGEQGDYTRAQQFARQRVELEPWVEEGQQQLMRMLALGGETSTALAHYQHYRRRLASELHAAPDPMTQALYESIQQRGLTAAHGILPTSDSILSAETPNNLVAPLTALVGRSREVEVVESLLRRSDVRLVTLTGTGGVGKTRLSEQIAADLLDDFGDGVYFVSLAPVRNPELMPSVVARVLGQREAQHRSALDVLKAALRAKTVLLVLDNFEQILSAAPVVVDLLRACPRLKILVTSREALRVRGEHEYVVQPLALPPSTALPVSDLAQYSAIEVFRQRAVAARCDFVLDESSGPVVVRVCERLGGLPLAIELAAARIRHLSPQALLQQLEDDPSAALHRLRAHARDVPERHRSLWNAIAWSYALLGAEEQALFRRLAVFVGGWTADAAGSVCGEELALDIGEALESLADKHLVQEHQNGAATPRYTMLEPLREFGLALMAQAGELQSVQARMAGYFLPLAEAANAAMLGAGYTGSHKTLLTEYANLQSALSWALAAREVEVCLRLCAALQHFWNSYPREAERNVLQALAVAEGAPLSVSYALVLISAGYYSWTLGNSEVAQRYFERGLAANEAIGDRCPPFYVGIAHGILSWIMFDRGDYARADAYHRAELAHAMRAGDDWARAMALLNMGVMCMHLGDYAEAQRLMANAAQLHSEIGQAWGIALAATHLGELYIQLGEYESARRVLAEGLALIEEHELVEFVLLHKRCLGQLAFGQVDYRQAAAQLGDALESPTAPQNPRELAEILELSGRLALKMGRPDHALLIVSGATELRRRSITFATPHQQTELDAVIMGTRSALGPEASSTLWAAGMAMTAEELLQYSLKAIQEMQGDAQTTERGSP